MLTLRLVLKTIQTCKDREHGRGDIIMQIKTIDPLLHSNKDWELTFSSKQNYHRLLFGYALLGFSK